MSELEINDEWSSQGVFEVQRVVVTKNTQKENTNIFFLIFAMAKFAGKFKSG